MIWKSNFTEEENKTIINMQALRGDCSVSWGLLPADLSVRGRKGAGRYTENADKNF